MSEITVSEQHKHAIELHQKIIVSANLAQQNIWDMCVSLKAMRDNKLYKELGYQNFEGYCETEVGFSRMQAHKYISIIENKNLTQRKIRCRNCEHRQRKKGKYDLNIKYIIF